MDPGVIVYFVDVDRQAVSHPGWHAERSVQRGCGDHHGIPGTRLRIPHAPEQLPIERVNVQAWWCGPPLGLGVKLCFPLGIDVNKVDLAPDRPVAPLEPGHIGVDHSLLITARTATLEAGPKPRQGHVVCDKSVRAGVVILDGVSAILR